ncbi:MAG TPA: hypothetical protein VJN70_04755 [Gemmatimonadaceae bacterium]|nr:hypothetical protein [Gemmatimonadaceae bacterium]
MSTLAPHEYRQPLTPATPPDVARLSGRSEEFDVDGLTVGDLVIGVVQRWRVVMWCVVTALLAATLALIFVPAVYRSRSSFVTSGSNGLKLSGGLSGAGLAGLASQFGLNTSADPSTSPDFYAELIDSRELLTRLALSRFVDPRSKTPNDSATLLQILDIKKKDPQRVMELAVKRLGKMLSVGFDNKTNLVTITADAKWSDLSAAIANRAVALVGELNGEQRRSRARARRSFVQERTDSAQAALDTAERQLRQFYEQNRQWNSAPTLVYEEGRLRRQVELANELYLTVRRELETARIDEDNHVTLITVVDSAIPPRKELWPAVLPAITVACVVGVLLGLMLAATLLVIADWAHRNPLRAARLSRAASQMRREMAAFPRSMTRSAPKRD